MFRRSKKNRDFNKKNSGTPSQNCDVVRGDADLLKAQLGASSIQLGVWPTLARRCFADQICVPARVLPQQAAENRASVKTTIFPHISSQIPTSIWWIWLASQFTSSHPWTYGWKKKKVLTWPIKWGPWYLNGNSSCWGDVNRVCVYIHIYIYIHMYNVYICIYI